jgi:putative endopeptidase
MHRKLAPRHLFAMALLALASGNLHAAKKPAAAAAPTACTDFYASTNADWLRGNPLPANAASFSRWDQLLALAARQTEHLLTVSDAQNAPGPASRLLADLIASGLDEASLDGASQATLKPLFDRIASIRKPRDLAGVVAELHQAGVPVLFELRVQRDDQTGRARAVLVPEALGLGDPAFYTVADPVFQDVMRLYRTYVADLLEYSGIEGKQLVQQSGWALSSELALAAAYGEGQQHLDLEAAKKQYPALFLGNFLQVQGAAPTQIVLAQPGFFAVLDKQWAKPAIPQWQAYLRARVLQSLAPALGRDPRRAYAALIDQTLARRLPRTQAERVNALVREQAPELLDAAFAERQLSGNEAARVAAIGEALRAAMGRAIERAPHLDATQKAEAQQRLAALRLAIGKPVIGISFEGLRFESGQYANNVLAVRRFAKARELDRLVSTLWPWPMPQTTPLVAYEAPQHRVIVTAAALQSPVFGNVSAAADYGALGALIGRQISLAFESMLAPQKTQALAAQFSATPPGAGANAGVLSQNAADLAGLELAWDALNAQGPLDATAKKAFFAAWAGLWPRHERDAAASLQEGFAPAAWRVNGSVSNHPEFARAFACKAKQPMFKAPAAQVSLWR